MEFMPLLIAAVILVVFSPRLTSPKYIDPNGSGNVLSKTNRSAATASSSSSSLNACELKRNSGRTLINAVPNASRPVAGSMVVYPPIAAVARRSATNATPCSSSEESELESEPVFFGPREFFFLPRSSKRASTSIPLLFASHGTTRHAVSLSSVHRGSCCAVGLFSRLTGRDPCFFVETSKREHKGTSFPSKTAPISKRSLTVAGVPLFPTLLTSPGCSPVREFPLARSTKTDATATTRSRPSFGSRETPPVANRVVLSSPAISQTCPCDALACTSRVAASSTFALQSPFAVNARDLRVAPSNTSARWNEAGT
mmetsp:Transcript_932/g.3053  ORF Transcript_932/g.3053 Transcript_932/m.3053 type:complete len:313 (+) Transcript_932:1890-2828(+)